MKPILLFALLIAVFSSCTTAYKTGQTPDDVYYSPAKTQEDYVKVEKEEEKEKQYNYDEEYYEDRYLRMKVRNRYRWSDLDEWYGYDRYSIGYNYVYASFNNPYNSWQYNYNPYCCCKNNILVIDSKNPAPQPVVKRHFNLAGYNNTNNNNNNTPLKTPVRTNTTSTYNNSNDGLSNKVKTIFDKPADRPSRTYSPSSSSGTSGNNNNNNNNSSSGTTKPSTSSGPVTRPTRN